MSFRLFSLLILSSLVLGGCSKYMPKLDKVLPDQRKEYQKSKSLPDLEVPPDLTTETIDDSLSVPDVDEGGSATFSTYQERVERQKENRQFSGASASGIAEISGEQLIIVSGSTSDTWITLQEFWSNLGYSLDLDDEELGVMETNWSGDEASQKRDKYKVFIEAEDEGKTAVYLSHKGESLDEGAWATRDRDLSLERRMALRMQSALGGASPTTGVATATAPDSSDATMNTETSDRINSELISAGDGKMYLAVQSDVGTVWPLVGEFLNGAEDITVESNDPSKGTYDIIYQAENTKKKGFVSKLAFWKSDNNEFKISVTKVGERTEIIVLDEDGDWDTSGQTDQILSRIRSNL